MLVTLWVYIRDEFKLFLHFFRKKRKKVLHFSSSCVNITFIAKRHDGIIAQLVRAPR